MVIVRSFFFIVRRILVSLLEVEKDFGVITASRLSAAVLAFPLRVLFPSVALKRSSATRN